MNPVPGKILGLSLEENVRKQYLCSRIQVTSETKKIRRDVCESWYRRYAKNKFCNPMKRIQDTQLRNKDKTVTLNIFMLAGKKNSWKLHLLPWKLTYFFHCSKRRTLFTGRRWKIIMNITIYNEYKYVKYVIISSSFSVCSTE